MKKNKWTTDNAVTTTDSERLTICSMRWEGHQLVIHPTPSTGYNFKHPAHVGRSKWKYFLNKAMNYLQTIFSKFNSVLDWRCCLILVIHPLIGAPLCFLQCFHHELSMWTDLVTGESWTDSQKR